MKRGPKIRTARNAADRRDGLIRRDAIESTSELSDAARAEFDRLVEVLDAKGTLDRVDLAVATEAARIKALLDKAHRVADLAIDPKAISVVGMLTSQRRGLLRELGLTLQPSRSLVRTHGETKPEEDPISKFIKITG